jgi:hypothetical protein
MKCIQAIRASKNVEVGDIARIGDVEAELRVKGNSYKYIPKTEWKKWKGTLKTEEVVTTNEVVEQKESKKKKSAK